MAYVTLGSIFDSMPSLRGSPVLEAVRRLEAAGKSVGFSGDIPGLFRIDGELTTGQLLDVAGKLPPA
jgi:hypothetical protein